MKKNYITPEMAEYKLAVSRAVLQAVSGTGETPQPSQDPVLD